MGKALSFYIARRYFKAKKTPLVTLIGRVAVLSIGVSTAAMMLILSVMNGMNRFVAERFWVVDPDLKIEAAEGKFFEVGNLLEKVSGTQGVQAVSVVLKDQAILTYGQQNCMVCLVGVDEGYPSVSALSRHIFSGEYNLQHNEYAASVLMGGGVYDKMQVEPSSTEPCRIYTIDAKALENPFGMPAAVSSRPVYASGLFSSIPEYDNQYVYCDLEFARNVFKTQGKASSLEVKVDPKGKKEVSARTLNKVKAALKTAIGEGFTVKDRIEQQQSMFKSMRAEKLIVVAVFAFIMLIATFTMVANQMLLMYEKRLDSAVLSSMGMRAEDIKQVFFLNGMLVNFCGTVGGLVLGTLLTLGQQKFGWVKLGGGNGNYITDAYPVLWQAGDMLAVLLIGLAIGALASAIPLRQVTHYTRRLSSE